MGNPTAHVIDDDAAVRDAVQLLGGEDIEVGPYAARVRHATIAQVFGD
jgi:FixJ family two-component response regulator